MVLICLCLIITLYLLVVDLYDSVEGKEYLRSVGVDLFVCWFSLVYGSRSNSVSLPRYCI